MSPGLAARELFLSLGLEQGLTEAVFGRFRACLVDPEPKTERETVGWAKTVCGMAQTICRGLSRVILTMATNNLGILLRLLAA